MLHKIVPNLSIFYIQDNSGIKTGLTRPLYTHTVPVDAAKKSAENNAEN